MESAFRIAAASGPGARSAPAPRAGSSPSSSRRSPSRSSRASGPARAADAVGGIAKVQAPPNAVKPLKAVANLPVRATPVAPGQPVEDGQLLLEIDVEKLEKELAMRRQELASIQEDKRYRATNKEVRRGGGGSSNLAQGPDNSIEMELVQKEANATRDLLEVQTRISTASPHAPQNGYLVHLFYDVGAETKKRKPLLTFVAEDTRVRSPSRRSRSSLPPGSRVVIAFVDRSGPAVRRDRREAREGRRPGTVLVRPDGLPSPGTRPGGACHRFAGALKLRGRASMRGSVVCRAFRLRRDRSGPGVAFSSPAPRGCSCRDGCWRCSPHPGIERVHLVVPEGASQVLSHELDGSGPAPTRSSTRIPEAERTKVADPPRQRARRADLVRLLPPRWHDRPAVQLGHARRARHRQRDDARPSRRCGGAQGALAAGPSDSGGRRRSISSTSRICARWSGRARSSPRRSPPSTLGGETLRAVRRRLPLRLLDHPAFAGGDPASAGADESAPPRRHGPPRDARRRSRCLR
ncbi:MAG: hypothetical protein R2862_04265 [Thermoanaerobaculia bacterium]